MHCNGIQAHSESLGFPERRRCVIPDIPVSIRAIHVHHQQHKAELQRRTFCSLQLILLAHERLSPVRLSVLMYDGLIYVL
jgi:hypothetical protein